MNTVPERVRIDKWLWAARFFKTRSLSAQAVEGGKARLNGERVKPAKEIRKGDMLQIRCGEFEWTVQVDALAERRGPASEAARLYTESEESRTRREAMRAMRKAEPKHDLPGRPT